MDAAEGAAPVEERCGGMAAALSDAPVTTPPDPFVLLRQATGPDPVAGLDAVAKLRSLIDAWEDLQVGRARDSGWNWAEIARKLGRHRQAVHREYARRSRPPAPGGDRLDGSA